MEGSAMFAMPALFTPYALALFQEPVSTFEHGGLVGVVVAMFIGNFVQNNLIKNELKAMQLSISSVAQGHQAIAINAAILQLLNSTQKLTEGLAAVNTDQKVLAANQTTLSTSHQQMTTELLGIIRDVDRG